MPQLPLPPTVEIPPLHTAVMQQPTIDLPRKFPAPCWSQEETLALINCYQDKWYSLRRRNLRTADWEAVAEEVGKRCPDQSLAKTSAQCRHKMEKLRKRYRTEKQRILSIPGNVPGNGRYFGSSWVFFDLIDSMELGSGGSENNVNANVNMNMNMNMNNVVSNHLQVGNVSKVDLEVKPFRMNNMNMNVNDGNSKKGDLGKYFDEMMMSMGSNNNNNNNNKSRNHEFVMRSPAPHMKFKVTNHHQQNIRGDYVSVGGDGGDLSHDFHDSRDYMDAPAGFKRKPVNYENGMPMAEEMVVLRKEKVSVAGDMVASVKMLGEGLIKMEKMKIEMMRDIEKMRMEMELKRSEMIIESQHFIVNAFVQGLKKHHSSNNNKVKVPQIE